MDNKVISHYKILGKIGEGGMGIVYKAQDTRLDRIVALKFLPINLTASAEDIARFQQEAKAISSLNHPGVATLYDVGESEGQKFIVLEYLPGDTLNSRIKQLQLQGKELSIKLMLDYSIQIAEGLSHAHKQGIIHRDLKTENIMLTAEGKLKLTDFGLAKLKGVSKLTKTGSAVGTVAYMSPEQAQGEEVDQLTDIFSFGIILYQMITGRLPFRGEHDAAIIYSICNEEAEPLARYKAGVPEDLQRIVSKALTKNKTGRYQNVDDLVVDLKRLQNEMTAVTKVAPSKTLISRYSVLALILIALAIVAIFLSRTILISPDEKGLGIKRKMLAILPFENLGPAEQEYFADGITDEIITKLSQVGGMGVIARTSSMKYKRTDKSIKQIGDELGVQYIMGGTVRWELTRGQPGRVRITPQLVNVEDNTNLWAETYDTIALGVLDIQSDIAQKVTHQLGITLLEPEAHNLQAKPTSNLQAYTYYLQGMDYVYRGGFANEKNLRLAAEMYLKAVQLDPKFALAYAKLSEIYSALYWFRFERTNECLRKAKQAADNSLRIDPNLPYAHLALGMYYYWGFLDYESAMKEFQLAQSRDPNSSRLLAVMGFIQRRQGKFKEAAANFEKSVQVNPRYAPVVRDLGATYEYMRMYEKAEDYFDIAISLSPDMIALYQEKASLNLIREGNTDNARSILLEASKFATREELVLDWVWIELIDENYKKTLDLISLETLDTLSYYSNKAVVYELLKQPQLMQAYNDSARLILEDMVKQEPSDARHHLNLGAVYAALGRKEEAIKEGKLATSLLPVSKDAMDGALMIEGLAGIYSSVGEYEAAIEQLEYLLSIPSLVSVNFLRIDPNFIPLRSHPLFQKLLGKYKNT